MLQRTQLEIKNESRLRDQRVGISYLYIFGSRAWMLHARPVKKCLYVRPNMQQLSTHDPARVRFSIYFYSLKAKKPYGFSLART